MAARISLAGPQSDVQGRMATATTGAGTLTLGGALSGATTFAGMPVPINDGDTLTYELIDIGVSPIGKEKGRGTYHSAGPTLSRDAVIWSTNGGARLNLSGNAYVFVTADDSDVVLVSQARTLLTAPATFWFDPTSGSDTTGTGTNANPWASPAPLFAKYDFGNQTVTLTLKNNATTQVALGPWTGGGALVLELNNKSVTNSNGSALAISGVLPGICTIQNGTLAGTSATVATASALQHLGGGQVNLSNITFNACTWAHVWASGVGGGQPAVSLQTACFFHAMGASQPYIFFVAAGAVVTTGFLSASHVDHSATGNLAAAQITVGVNQGFFSDQNSSFHKAGFTVPTTDTQAFNAASVIFFKGWVT
jgi:hypothetical protein